MMVKEESGETDGIDDDLEIGNEVKHHLLSGW
jgi:hypothetical protein